MITVKNTTTRRPAMALPPESAPPSRARRPTREVVRRRLLDAALQVFAEQGFASASLDQVAEAAGLTKGAIYSNFAGKDDLFFAMMARPGAEPDRDHRDRAGRRRGRNRPPADPA